MRRDRLVLLVPDMRTQIPHVCMTSSVRERGCSLEEISKRLLFKHQPFTIRTGSSPHPLQKLAVITECKHV